MLGKVILDADFCIKVGRFEGLLLLQEVIPVIAQKAYIHQYVYEDEILIPQSAKQQIKRLSWYLQSAHPTSATRPLRVL